MGDVTRLLANEQEVVDAFHRLYYPFFVDTKWLGVGAQKCPFDLFAYQEIVCETRPEVILECGTAEGGSAIYLASICELIGHGEVVTIDLNDKPHPEARPECPRLTYWLGDTVDPATVGAVQELVAGKETVLVILDDDHKQEHVLKELRTYSRFVTPGSYIIVEDTNINGHPVLPEFGPGPMEAVETFLKETRDFEIDRSREKFLVSFNPKGYLRRLGKPRRPTPEPWTQRGVVIASLEKDLADNRVTIAQQKRELKNFRSEVELMKRQREELLRTLASINGSVAWEIIQRYRAAKELLLPSQTVRRRIYDKLLSRLGSGRLSLHKE